MRNIKENKNYAVKEMRYDKFDDLLLNFREFLAYFRIPCKHKNIIQLIKIYLG